MFDAIASRYELVNKLMTFGLDTRMASTSRRDLALTARKRGPRRRRGHR
jgi:ubiquinone/menaquinone biosynthesis C-methylase UbiE